MHPFVKFYIRHVAIGFLAAAAFVALLLWFNVANLWTLISHSAEGWLAVVLLVVFHGIVFSGVQFGIAVMGLAERDDTPKGPGLRESAIAARVVVEGKKVTGPPGPSRD